MTKRTRNSTTTEVIYAAQRQNVKGAWIPVLAYGYPIEAYDIASVKRCIKERRRGERWGGVKPLKGRVRIVKVTTICVDKVTVIKEVV